MDRILAIDDLCQYIDYNEAEYAALEKNPNLSKDEIAELRESAVENFYKEVDEKKKEPLVRMNVIEEMLNVLGVRLARPYEHWNEMESYYEYIPLCECLFTVWCRQQDLNLYAQ